MTGLDDQTTEFLLRSSVLDRMSVRLLAEVFDRWPNGWGFEYFYGFLGGGASQWDPCLTENQTIIGTPAETELSMMSSRGSPRKDSRIRSSASASRERRSWRSARL